MKDIDVKVIANYLPQFHVIPQNSQWWGEGYTDWVAVKQAKPQFKGHYQPHVPLGGVYYSLDNPEVLQWQADLAKKYNIYGFGMYHYWFSSDLQLLQKPAELLLAHPEIDIHFMFIWDNASWTRTWTRKGAANDWAPQFDQTSKRKEDTGILAELNYGTEEDWKKHFDYLLPFFQDERYIKLDGKPMFAFFQTTNNFELQKKMVAYWEKLAINAGFPGLVCMSKNIAHNLRFEYRLRYSPFSPNNFMGGIKNRLCTIWTKKRNRIRFVDYDSHWRSILSDARSADEKTFLSGFVSFDDTPRRGEKARIIRGATPYKFRKYLTELLSISRQQGKEYTFVTAWNEWGEGAHLEPDELNGYAWLQAVKDAVETVNSVGVKIKA